MLEAVLKIIAGYLIGSISGSLLMGKIKGVDIRKMGSGNAGGTNAFRTQGAKFALAVVFIDIAKGYISTWYVATLTVPFLPESGVIPMDLLQVLCGTAAIMGHVYPIYHGFKGGKGAGAAVGTILAISPGIMLLAVLIWIINLVLTGYVGLGTMLAALSIPLMTLWFGHGLSNQYFLYFSILIAIFILFTHRSNIRRMLAGTENRFENAMILRKLKGKKS